MHRPALAIPSLVVGALAFAAADHAGESEAHRLTVVPAHPTTADTITLEITGEWPDAQNLAATPSVVRDGALVRIDIVGVLPGVPVGLETYERRVDLGMLPPGSYRAEYFIEALAAPSKAVIPDAVLDFVVIAAVPTLGDGALAVLATVLVAGALWTIRRGPTPRS